jgi:uncharacterized protein with PIN domain
MPAKELKDTGAKRLVKSEGFRNYLIGIGATTGLVLGLLAQFKGEPVAEKTWTTLRDQVNKQSEAINKLNIRMETFQAVQEARTSFVLEHELEELQKKYDELSAEQNGSAQPEALPAAGCHPGHVKGADGKCRAVHTSVVTKMRQNEKQAVSARKELEEERRKRMAAESKKQDLVLELLGRGDGQRPLQALPKSLEDASSK